MIIPLLFSYITLFATCCIEYSTLTVRHRLFTHIWVRALAYTLGTCVYLLFIHIGNIPHFFYYFNSLMYLFVCNYLFTESLPQKIFLFFAAWCFTTFDSSLCNWATAWIETENLRFVVRAGLYLSSFIILLPVYNKYLRHYVKELLYLFNKSNPVYAFFPVLSLVLFTILFGPLNPTITVYQFITMTLFICFILFTFYLMTSHFHSVFMHLKVENNLMNAERQLFLQKQYYAEVDKGVRIQKERIHDTRHHLLALSSMASDGNIDAMNQYLSTLLEQYSQARAPRYCGNDVANAVLGGYISIAEDKGIAVSAELDLPKTMGIDEYELCTIFGNTLENAIEACLRIPADSPLYSKRYIKLKSRVEQDRLTIRIENSFPDDRQIKKESFLSSKGDKGGIGLESVKAVVELYQGSLKYESDAGVFIFSAVLCLRPL